MKKIYFQNLPVGSFFQYCGIDYLKTNEKYEQRKGVVTTNALCLDSLAEYIPVSFKKEQWVEMSA